MCEWKVQLKYMLCRCKYGCEMCRCKINDLIKKQTEPLSFLSPLTPWVSETPFALLTPIRLLYPLGLSLLPCLLRPPLPRNCLLCFPKIAGCLGPFSASEIASGRIYCWAAISLSNTSPRSNRAFKLRHKPW